MTPAAPFTTLRPTVEPRPKQQELFDLCNDPEAHEILISGSIRAGKTQAACAQIASWAYRFGGTHLVGRVTYQELEDSTKKVMLRGDGGLPPALPPELVRKEISGTVAGGNKVILHNGAEIVFRSLEDPRTAEDKVKNITLASFFLDQAEELADDEYESSFYETLTGRLSDPCGPRKGILATNPAAETHWIYRRFIQDSTRLPWTRYIHVTLFDNADVLPDGFVQQALKRKLSAPEWYERNVLGKWGAFEGKRFKAFRPDRHVVPGFTLPREWELTEGIDYGWTHPFAVVWHAVADDGHEYVVAEHHQSERPISFHAKRIKDVRKELGLSPSGVWLDPSAWAQRGEYESCAAELYDYGIPAAKAVNDRLGGWNRIEEKLISEVANCTCPVKRPGSPRLLFFEGCPQVQKELRSAKRKLGMDDIEKRNDDAIDALRYVIASRPLGPHERQAGQEVMETDRYARYTRRLKERAGDRERSQADVVIGV